MLCNLVTSKNIGIYTRAAFHSIRERVCACKYTKTFITGGYTVTTSKKVTRRTLWQKKKS